MEDHERSRITECLPRLIALTSCSAPLLAYLMANGVLSQDDVDVIDCKGTPSQKASELYRISQAKRNGYELLIDALRETNQTGAVAVLTLPERAKRQLQDIVTERGSRRSTPKRAKSSSSRNNIRFGVKAPSNLFTGRSDELEELHKIFQESHSACSPRVTVVTQTIAISGLGGIGKSQLAKEYIHRHSSHFQDNIIWMNAESEEALADSFRRLATDHLEISTKNANGVEKNITAVVEEVYGKFTDSVALFVLDNADKEHYIAQFLPQTGWENISPYILITSRDMGWKQESFNLIKLQEMKEEDAIEFVMKGLKITSLDVLTNELIRSLVQKLQCFPLAIQQAISFIVEQDMMDDYSIRNYLDEFEGNQKDLLSSDHSSLQNDYQKTTFTTWKMTMEKISGTPNGDIAIQILNCVAYLSPEGIERSMLYALLPERSEREVKLAVNLLVRYSMLNGEQKQSTLSVHRLVQQVIRIELYSTGKEEIVLGRNLQVLQPENEDVRLTFIDHAQSAWSHAQKDYPNFISKHSRLPHDIMKAMSFRGLRYSDALSFGTGESGMKLLESRLPPEHPSVLMLEYQICKVLFNQGKFENSLERLSVLTEKFQSSGGSPHLFLLHCRRLIARIFMNQRKLEQSYNNYLEILELGKGVAGWEGERTADCLNEMGMVCYRLEKWVEASSYYDMALEAATSVLGPESYLSIAIIDNKSMVTGVMGDYSGTVEILQSRRSLSSDSIETKLMVRQNIAFFLQRMGKYELALEYCREAIEGFERYWGELHPLTLLTSQLKGFIMVCLGDNVEAAVDLLCRSYAGLQQQLGEGHEFTYEAKAHLAMAWYCKDRSEGALFTIEETIRSFQNKFGRENRFVLWMCMDFGVILEMTGQHEKCTAVLESVRQIILSRFGSSHFEISKIGEIMNRIKSVQ